MIFAGPSLHGVTPHLPDGVELRPPAALGDLWRAALAGYRILGLVDGRFGDVPAIWHQEILAVLDIGATVLGAASMGALRAAELDGLGMIGLGQVHAAFRDGLLVADDEVAVVHGPAETGFAPASDALVDLRATLDAASARGEIAVHEAVLLTEAMHRIWFPERSRARLVAEARALLGPARASVIEELCARRWVSVKTADALLLVDEVVALQARCLPAQRGDSAFEETLPWRAARLSLPGSNPIDRPPEEPMPSWFDRAPLTAPDRRPWALALYVGADNDLAADVGGDIDELRSAGASPKVHVAGQVHVPGCSVSGRFLLGPKADGELRAPIEIAPFGPRDSGDVATLTGFLEWSLVALPADRRALVMWGHGRGLSVLGDDTEGGWIELDELGRAFATAGLDTDRRLALLGFDACMMASAECLVECAPFADWIVASQQVVPDEGWAYDAILQGLGRAVLEAEALGRLIVDSYVADHGRRRQGDVDIVLLDPDPAGDLARALGALGDALIPLLEKDGKAIDGQRMLARTFRNGELVDLGDVADRLAAVCDDRRLQSAVRFLKEQLAASVVHQRSIRGFDVQGLAQPDPARSGLSLVWPRIAGAWQRLRPAYQRLRLVREGGEGWVRFLDAALGPGTA
ncbi:TfuA-like protein [Geminicoccus flavidas]|uniref:TfuA-like protein n=1 Tax=Geminicoccus flavidas TaxID=2506407 RepID=UPI00135B12AD|nr:TfuA-like protein [Geminicoccus flavidas]